MMMAATDWNVIGQVSAARIVDCLVRGTAIALCAGVISKFARRTPSGTRFAVWFAALMTIASLPLLSGIGRSSAVGISAANVASRAPIVVPEVWGFYLFVAWAAIAGFALLRVGISLMHLRALRASCVPVDPNSLDASVGETLSRNRGKRAVALYLSDLVHVPTAVGFGNPAIIIPRWLMTELSPAELNQILLHELAHLRRRDDWTNLLQKIVKAIFFFHPAVWWIEKRVSLEREMACDDAVVAETASPRAYAECLARLAEKSFLRRSLALAQAAIGRIRQTSLRVARILDGNRPSASRADWKPAVLLVGVFTALCGVGFFETPQLVAFQDASEPAAKPAIVLASNRLPVQGSSVAPGLPAAGAHPVAWRSPIVAKSVRTRRSRGKAITPAQRPSRPESFESALVFETPNPQAASGDMVRAAGLRTDSTAPAQAVFVVVESQCSALSAATCQISVWRVTLQYPVSAPVNKTIPRKT